MGLRGIVVRGKMGCGRVQRRSGGGGMYFGGIVMAKLLARCTKGSFLAIPSVF